MAHQGGVSDAAVLDAAAPPIDKASAPRDLAVVADLPTAALSNNAFGIALYDQLAPTANGGNFLTSR